jgi:hypothetical protein
VPASQLPPLDLYALDQALERDENAMTSSARVVTADARSSQAVR